MCWQLCPGLLTSSLTLAGLKRLSGCHLSFHQLVPKLTSCFLAKWVCSLSNDPRQQHCFATLYVVLNDADGNCDDDDDDDDNVCFPS